MSSPGSQENPGVKKERKGTLADETVSEAERHKKRSFWCNLIGNIIVGMLLLAYIIVSIVLFANKHWNSTTTVQFSLTKNLEFPAIFFQITEYGTVEKITVTSYGENCKIVNTNNASKIGYVSMHNPTAAQVNKYADKWVIVNTTLTYYNLTGYAFNFSAYYNASKYGYSSDYSDSYNYSLSYSRRRQLLDSNYTNYTSYFSNYNISDYFTSASSNIYYVIPPNGFNIHTNTEARCGDVVRIYIESSVPKGAFNASIASNAFTLSLHVRSFPDSFGLQYGYDSRAAVLSSYGNKDHIYYGARLAFGEIKSEEVRETIYKDKVFHNSQTFYQTLSTIDYTNSRYNLTTITDSKIYFSTYLYVYANEFLSEYKTVQKESWLDVLCNIGGMNSSIGDSIAFFIVIWLYGTSLLCLQFNGTAPLDPLPDDFLKRFDVYIANKVIIGELRAGEAWEHGVTTTTE